jgi:fatty-acyl-CoA synthase
VSARLGPGAERHPDRSAPLTLGAPAGVPPVESLVELLEHRAEQRGDICAYFIDLNDNIRRLSYDTLRTRARRWASRLRELGVEPGDRVLIALPTGEELLVAFFACQYCAALPCIVEAPAKGRALAAWCGRIGPKLKLAEPLVLVVEASLRDAVRSGLEPLGSLPCLVDPDWLDPGSPLATPVVGRTALLQFTSGTTSHPKAVVCSQAAVLENLRCIGSGVRQFRERDLMIGWLPLFHDMGLVATTLAAVAHGIPVALMPPAAFVLRPARFLWAVHVLRASLSFAPNFAYRLCLRRLAEADPELEGLDLSSWRIAFNAAEFVQAETARAFSARFARYGLPANAMTPAYGMAEMAVGISSHDPAAALRVDLVSRECLARDGQARAVARESPDALELVSLGRVMAGHQLEIRDPLGNALPERHQGEIVLRGPSLFDGYFRDPEATRGVLSAGWLRTGDLGYLADGEVFITGRAKDLIIRGGENHHPHLLEDAASGVAGVRSGCVAAVGLLSETSGTEQIALLVETRETGDEARQRLRRAIEEAVQRVSGLRPDHVLLVSPNRVPVTTSGKVRRAAAREVIMQELGIRNAASAQRATDGP